MRVTHVRGKKPSTPVKTRFMRPFTRTPPRAAAARASAATSSALCQASDGIVDVSTSITSMGYTKQRLDEGALLPGPWLIDAMGNATDNPAVAWIEPKGALLPLGGIDAGHKGFGLGLMIEALTAGLSGYGRADPGEGWGATVFVQVLDPEAFGGLPAFRRQMDFMADAARNTRPRPGVDRVRLPGEGGLKRYREQQEKGVALYPTIMPALLPWATKLGVTPPQAS